MRGNRNYLLQQSTISSYSFVVCHGATVRRRGQSVPRLRDSRRNAKPISPVIIPFFGLRGLLQTAPTRPPYRWPSVPAEPQADDDPAVPGRQISLLALEEDLMNQPVVE